MYSDNDYILLLISKFLKRVNRPFKKKELTVALLSHPFYPAISSISQTLTYLGINNKVYRADYTGVLKANSPALAHLKDNRFILLLKADTSQTTYYDAVTNKYITGPAEDFRNRWSGYILYITEQSPKTAYPSRFRFHIPHLYLFCYLLIVGSSIILYVLFPVNGISLLLLKMSGFLVCLGFISHYLSPGSATTYSLCKTSSVFDCDRVLQSPASRLMGKIPLSAVGLAYFCMGILALINGYLAHCATTITTSLYYISVTGLPFILFSFIYQGTILKKWCPLCLATCSIILIENILFYFYPIKTVFSNNLFSSVLILAFSGITAAGIATLIEIYAQAKQKSKHDNIEFLKLKRNPAIAYTSFQQQPCLNTQTFSDMLIGEKNAPHTLITVLNPSCKPCRKAANDIIHLLETYPGKVKWLIRFDGTDKPENSPVNSIQLHLLELYQKINDSSKFLSVLKAWFTHPLPDFFTRHYPVPEISPDTITRLKAHIYRNQKDKIEKIPYIAIGKRALPVTYTINDLAYFFPEEEFLKKITDE